MPAEVEVPLRSSKARLRRIGSGTERLSALGSAIKCVSSGTGTGRLSFTGVTPTLPEAEPGGTAVGAITSGCGAICALRNIAVAENSRWWSIGVAETESLERQGTWGAIGCTGWGGRNRMGGATRSALQCSTTLSPVLVYPAPVCLRTYLPDPPCQTGPERSSGGGNRTRALRRCWTGPRMLPAPAHRSTAHHAAWPYPWRTMGQ